MKLKSLLLLLIIASAKLSFAQNGKSPFDTTQYGRNAAVGQYADIRGFKMYYETYGRGEPLLIIHGNGGSINNFLYQIPFFAKSYKVIIADSRAQGKSVDPTDSLSYEMMTDDLNALLDKLNLKQCYVIGWSDGGINGLLLAIRHPDKVKKLAVTGANLWPDSTAVDPFVYKWAMNENEKVKKEAVTPKTKNELKLLHLLSYEQHITVEQLHTITCPTLVIGGDHDVILPVHTMLIAQSIPNSYLWIIPNSGHSTPVFKKDQFNAIVADFFTSPFRKIDGYGKFR
ncbi:pimeloyl-ACP methyl ester carboxylesterase [Mucilaginibacter frigoritolerans]|uniref:Pimeloyl-ACP methyl ester carboxylesterase n=1 Tax=Mucilaginibacter frigoritolerans TaxID=652788 RepID=A0A562U3S0_9SPHI|nr:alpha/beta hydrolase [Mucilaginibacter frigoritolerans]TWJ00015.1 pimeloyl-ACP methyl ester carboxylesterase [Mucilaginibacter frigoritolerans]